VSLMDPAKASHPAAAGDVGSVGRAELTHVVPHTIAGALPAMQRQRVTAGPIRDHRHE
jgi:hypothetical protein